MSKVSQRIETLKTLEVLTCIQFVDVQDPCWTIAPRGWHILLPVTEFACIRRVTENCRLSRVTGLRKLQVPRLRKQSRDLLVLSFPGLDDQALLVHFMNISSRLHIAMDILL